MNATVVITTHNRKEELREAIRSVIAQISQVEILVIDDGSTDGTFDMVRTEFPAVRLERSEISQGYICQRNQGACLAKGEIVFSIDDDARMTSPHVVAQTMAEFADPKVGAVAIPYTEPNKSPLIHQKSPSKDKIHITDDFIGTAHALRKDVFLELGGYRESLFHQGEEKDYCIRMLEAGYVVRLGNADLIHHMESPKRDFSRMDFYGVRNAIGFAWFNVPWPYFPIHLIATSVKCLLWTLEPRRFLIRLKGLVAGYADCLKYKRQPVSVATYRKFRSLRQQPQIFETTRS